MFDQNYVIKLPSQLVRFFFSFPGPHHYTTSFHFPGPVYSFQFPLNPSVQQKGNSSHFLIKFCTLKYIFRIQNGFKVYSSNIEGILINL
jgi:hypothetical protein